MNTNWHQLPVDKVFSATASSRQGLNVEAVAQKMTEFGPNELQEKKKKPAWVLFLYQFKDFMILVLIAAAIISGIAGDVTDTIIILVIVLLNAILGFVQEFRAEKAMEALKKIASLHSNVLRNGQTATILAAELVPGDVVLLEAGSVVPADLRLFEVHALRIEESSLTGESVPVDKITEALSEDDLSPADRINMVYKSTLVTNGRGKGIVIATGMQTEIGKIAKLLQSADSLTPLQKRMADFGRKLSYLILIICAILFGVGLLRGEDPLSMLLVSISLAVAAIPEALPALITIALAIGAKRMVKQNALIRKLPAVETLGSVTFICTDKTGTLTRNKMEVVEVLPFEEEELPNIGVPLLHCSLALNQDVVEKENHEWLGDPTEIALVNYYQRHHAGEALQDLWQRFPRVGELPFDSTRKRMTTIHPYGNNFLVIVKGATEAITAVMASKEHHQKILQQTNELASKGQRVLAFGYRVLDQLPDPLRYEDIEKELRFSGLVGMIDPPRDGIIDAIKECKSAGIQPVMITGDHEATATAIATEIGILTPNKLVLTGSKLSKLSPAELDEQVEQVRVYARVSPEQKLDIVQSLQRKHHFVAMTGDGVNDAPSLKTADIGIAMGITGTDVSKEAAAMILLDDNFATIVTAMKEGRRIYDNIRKFVKYIMTCNSAEIWTIFMAPLIGLPVPLQPVQILWINLVTDGLPGLTLSAEKAEANIMQRPPRKTNESLFAGGIAYHIIWVGLLMAALTLGTQAWAIHAGNAHWQTMVFTTLSLAQLGHVVAIRSEYNSIYKIGIFSNLPLIGAVLLTFLLQLCVIYLPFANPVFNTQPLSLNELLISIGASVVLFHAVEAEKWIKKGIQKRKERMGR